RPWFVAVADLRGDGIQDLVVANSGTPGSGADGSVSVFLGNGDGTFQPAQNFSAGARPQSVAVGGLRGDGSLDLAVANAGDSVGHGEGVSVLLGNGDGTFGPAQAFGTGKTPDSVAVGDFNGDGHLDLAVANGSSGTVSVLLGNGDGAFGPSVDYATGRFPPSFVTV